MPLIIEKIPIAFYSALKEPISYFGTFIGIISLIYFFHRSRRLLRPYPISLLHIFFFDGTLLSWLTIENIAPSIDAVTILPRIILLPLDALGVVIRGLDFLYTNGIYAAWVAIDGVWLAMKLALIHFSLIQFARETILTLWTTKLIVALIFFGLGAFVVKKKEHLLTFDPITKRIVFPGSYWPLYLWIVLTGNFLLGYFFSIYPILIVKEALGIAIDGLFSGVFWYYVYFYIKNRKNSSLYKQI